jgi:glycopeptide antibiotics resistance protein
VIVASVLALPVAVLIVIVLLRWRTSSGIAPREALRRSVAEVGAVAGTLPWLWMVLTPTSGDRQVTLVPLRDIAELASAPPVVAVVQVGGNLLVLAAFGAFLPVRFAALARLHRVAATAAGVSATIELLQYVLNLGRVSSVDDVLMNTTGALIGALITRRWWARRSVTAHDGAL